MFVTFEGPEGAGKSTAIRQCVQALESAGHRVLSTREPGAGEFGKRIRAMLLEGGEIPARSEVLLFLADRANHLETIVKPALDKGQIVLCDRHADSTLVYQGYARGLDLEFLRQGNQFATGGLVPDLTLLLDLPPEVGLERIAQARGPDQNRLDREPLEFHRTVREGFLQLAATEKERFVVVDATVGADEVAQTCLKSIWARLQEKCGKRGGKGEENRQE